jgi:hypothetical protein
VLEQGPAQVRWQAWLAQGPFSGGRGLRLHSQSRRRPNFSRQRKTFSEQLRRKTKNAEQKVNDRDMQVAAYGQKRAELQVTITLTLVNTNQAKILTSLLRESGKMVVDISHRSSVSEFSTLPSFRLN